MHTERGGGVCGPVWTLGHYSGGHVYLIRKSINSPFRNEYTATSSLLRNLRWQMSPPPIPMNEPLKMYQSAEHGATSSLLCAYIFSGGRSNLKFDGYLCTLIKWSLRFFAVENFSPQVSTRHWYWNKLCQRTVYTLISSLCRLWWLAIP